jgi:hypothetical protein
VNFKSRQTMDLLGGYAEDDGAAPEAPGAREKALLALQVASPSGKEDTEDKEEGQNKRSVSEEEGEGEKGEKGETAPPAKKRTRRAAPAVPDLARASRQQEAQQQTQQTPVEQTDSEMASSKPAVSSKDKKSPLRFVPPQLRGGTRRRANASTEDRHDDY